MHCADCAAHELTVFLMPSCPDSPDGLTVSACGRYSVLVSVKPYVAAIQAVPYIITL